MTNVDFGRLNLNKISIIIDDLDNCLFSYPEGYAERFSIETARASRIIAENLIRGGREDERLINLLFTDEDVLIEKAMKSYEDHGFTTRVFLLEYGLNEVDLYKAHHYLISRDVVSATFNRLSNQRLNQGIQLLRDAGLRQFVFTNGTEDYAREVTGQLGIAHLYNRHVGIDSVNDLDPPKKGKMLLLPKHVRQAWYDFIQHANIRTYVSQEEAEGGPDKKEENIVHPFLIGQEREKGKKYKMWNYSHCMFFDDSPANLQVAKTLGMQTVLVRTDRVEYDDQKMSYIDASTDNVAEFKCYLAEAILKQNKQFAPNFRSPRRLVGIR